MIRPVDERDVGVDVAQRPRRRQTGEAAADNDDLPPLLLSDASGNSFLERPCGEGHHQNESYEQDAVDAAVAEGQCPQLSKDLDRDRPVGMSVEYDTCHELPNRGHRRQQRACNKSGRAAGNTTRRIVSHHDAPSPRAASSSDGSICLSEPSTAVATRGMSRMK